MRRPLLWAVGVGFALSLGGCATDAGQAAPSFRPWTGFEDHPGAYSTRQTVLKSAGFVGGPPKADSDQVRADMETFRALRSLQGTARWEQAAADNEIETPRAPLKAFACALGVEIAPAEAPVLTTMLGKVLGELQLVQHDLKAGSAFRDRPFLVEPSAPICIKPEPWLGKSSSYPSGHSATGWAWALVLAGLSPDRREEILKRGYEYGQSRAICGVHFQSDVDAGRIVGAGLVAGLQSNPDFQRDVPLARAELARARAKAAPPAGCGDRRL